MCAALVIRHGMDLVHDHRLHMAQVFACLRTGEQQIQRLRRGDQDVRRHFQHGHAILGQRVSGTQAGADVRQQVAALQRQLQDLAQRLVQVFLHVVAQCFQRRYIHHLREGREPALDRFDDQAVDGNQKCRECLAGSGGSRDQRRFTPDDRGPTLNLWLSG